MAARAGVTVPLWDGVLPADGPNELTGGMSLFDPPLAIVAIYALGGSAREQGGFAISLVTGPDRPESLPVCLISDNVP